MNTWWRRDTLPDTMAVNDKLFLIGGCSFTAREDPKHESWAWQLQDDLRVGGEVLNTAEMVR